MGMFYDLVTVQEYLDRLIKLSDEWQAAKDFNSRTHTVSGPEFRRIWLSDDVECFADVLGEEVKTARVPLPDGKICIYKSFEYNGYEVFQVKQEPAGGENE